MRNHRFLGSSVGESVRLLSGRSSVQAGSQERSVNKKNMSSKEYRLTHYSKRERQRVWTRRSGALGESHRKGEWKRASRKQWTVNRSPHGHKTAREQFGRDRWERKRSLVESSRALEERREKRLRTREKGRTRERRVVEKKRCGVD